MGIDRHKLRRLRLLKMDVAVDRLRGGGVDGGTGGVAGASLASVGSVIGGAAQQGPETQLGDPLITPSHFLKAWHLDAQVLALTSTTIIRHLGGLVVVVVVVGVVVVVPVPVPAPVSSEP